MAPSKSSDVEPGDDAPESAVSLPDRGWRQRLAAVFVPVVLAVALAALRTVDHDLLQISRLSVFDLLQRLEPREQTHPDIVIIDIDERSLQELGQWPWPRTYIADMVDNLSQAGVASIGFDVLFAEPDRISIEACRTLAPQLCEIPRQEPLTPLSAETGSAGDQRLAEALANAPVALGVIPDVSPEAAPHEIRVPGSRPPLLINQPRAEECVPGYSSLVSALPHLAQAADGVGVFAAMADLDGVVRRVPLILRVGPHLYPTLTLAMLQAADERAALAIAGAGGQTCGIRRITVGSREIPTPASGILWLHYTTPGAYPRISAVDVQRGTFDPGAVAGRYALVGASAHTLEDLAATPLGRLQPGVEVHAQALDNILSGAALNRPDFALALELFVFLAASLLLIRVMPRLGALLCFGLLAVLAVVLVLLSWQAYSQIGLLLDPVFPLLGALIIFLSLIYANYAREELRRQWIRSAFSQFVPPAVVEELTRRPELLRVQGEQRELTMLFTDLAGFTAFTETQKSSTVVRILNRYIDGMGAIVQAHGGTLDKLVGDALIAFWNAPLDQPDHAEQAVACALAMDRWGRAFQDELQRNEGLRLGVTRIGLNSGRATVGNFGGQARLHYTAYGDAMNTASRLEGANKDLGTTLCIAAATVERCEATDFRPIGALRVQGRAHLVETFEPLQPQAPARAYLDAYRQAFAHLARGEIDDAKTAFAALMEIHGEDPLVRLHHMRLQAGETNTVIKVSK